MRGLDTILNQLQVSLQTANSPVTDFAPQSAAYTLFRSIAAAIQQTELIGYDPLLTNADITTATGTGLDRFAQTFGLSRQQAAVATGFLLVTGATAIALPNGTIFTDPQTGNQYLSTNSTSIALSAFIETPVPVAALLAGSGRALTAGTKLISQNEQILDVVVGFERKFDGTACGNMQDGTTLESDNSLRQRIYALLRAGGLINEAALRTVLIEHPAVDDALIDTPTAGVVRALVKTTSTTPDALKDELTALIQSYLVAVAVQVIIQTPTPLAVELNVRTALTSDLNALKANIRAVVEQYVALVRTTKYFDLDELKALVAPYVDLVEVVQPTESLQWSNPIFLELGDLNVNLKI